MGWWKINDVQEVWRTTPYFFSTYALLFPNEYILTKDRLFIVHRYTSRRSRYEANKNEKKKKKMRKQSVRV